MRVQRVGAITVYKPKCRNCQCRNRNVETKNKSTENKIIKKRNVNERRVLLWKSEQKSGWRWDRKTKPTPYVLYRALPTKLTTYSEADVDGRAVESNGDSASVYRIFSKSNKSCSTMNLLLTLSQHAACVLQVPAEPRPMTLMGRLYNDD